MAGTFDDRYNKAESATRFIKKRVSEVSPTLDSDDDSPSEKKRKLKPALFTSIVAGGLAGVVVDIGLFPLDTIKTRLQSEIGFRAAGGFRGVYKGIIPVLLTSAPLSALFFATYNTAINTMRTGNAALNPFVYFTAATAAEILCASIRAPLEILKQRQQTTNNTALYLIKKTYRKEGFRGFYRGFRTTLMREIPFAAIQYPLWEYMIQQLIIYENGEELTALQTAVCGAAAGAIAGALTTPVDVIKTRIMLADKEKIEKYKPFVNTNFARDIYRDRGITGFFAGLIPRVLWITLGGFLYFGAYETVRIICEKNWCEKSPTVVNPSPSYIEEAMQKLPYLTDNLCKMQSKLLKKQTLDGVEEGDVNSESLSNENSSDEVVSLESIKSGGSKVADTAREAFELNDVTADSPETEDLAKKKTEPKNTVL